jgi:hypothetical protein
MDRDAGQIPPQPPSGQWTLTCRVCGRTVVVETKDTREYLSRGWPGCCGEVMTLSIEPREPPEEPAGRGA